MNALEEKHMEGQDLCEQFPNYFKSAILRSQEINIYRPTSYGFKGR